VLWKLFYGKIAVFFDLQLLQESYLFFFQELVFQASVSSASPLVIRALSIAARAQRPLVALAHSALIPHVVAENTPVSHFIIAHAAPDLLLG